MSAPDDIHISIPQLWAHSKNAGSLSDTERSHLERCEQCIAILWLCNASQSIDEVQIKLKSKRRCDPD